MTTNYSRHDKLEPKDLWKVPAVIAGATAILFSLPFVSKAYLANKHKLEQETKIEQRQSYNPHFDLELLSECEGGMK